MRWHDMGTMYLKRGSHLLCTLVIYAVAQATLALHIEGCRSVALELPASRYDVLNEACPSKVRLLLMLQQHDVHLDINRQAPGGMPHSAPYPMCTFAPPLSSAQ